MVTTGRRSPVSSSTWHKSRRGGRRSPRTPPKQARPRRSHHVGSRSARREKGTRTLQDQSRHPAIRQIPPWVVSNSPEVQLPHLIRSGGLLRERRPAVLGQLSARLLVLGGQQQALVAHRAQHRALSDDVSNACAPSPTPCDAPIRVYSGHVW